MKCIFKESEDDINIKVCTVCGLVVKSKFPVHMVHAECGIYDPNVKMGEIELDFGQPKIVTTIDREEKKAEGDRPMPSLLKQGFNFLGALKDFAMNPDSVSDAEYKKRLEICDTCDRRVDNRCSECGCFLSWKAQGAAFHCPLKKWPGDV